MASYSRTSIYDIIVNDRIPDGLHTFTANDVNLGANQTEVKNFYGSQTVNSANLSMFFDDVTGAQDDIMCVRIFHGDLTIDNGVTFTPPYRTKGLFLFVKGNLINNGTISMTARGSSAIAPTGDVRIWTGADIPATGGAGAAGVNITTNAIQTINGTDGGTAPARGTGGGGSGSARKAGTNSHLVTSGSGSSGTAWSGGNGGGGARMHNQNIQLSADATISGGGNGQLRYSNLTSSVAEMIIGGGAGISRGLARRWAGGVPGTTNASEYNVDPYRGGHGSGGLLMIAVLGTYKDNGLLESKGSAGGQGFDATGGGSGGGSINVLAKQYVNATDTVITSPTNDVSGGSGQAPSNFSTFISGAGSDGTATFDTLATPPRRTMIKADNKLWYRDFVNNQWLSITDTSVDAFASFGMLDAELYALTSTDILAITNLDPSAINIQTYQP